MSEHTIEIGDEVRTKVGKVIRLHGKGSTSFAEVKFAKELAADLIYIANLELVRKHNQPAVAVTSDKWAGVKKVKLEYFDYVYDVIHEYGEWLGLRCDKSPPFYALQSKCTPYTPLVTVGSRVRDVDGDIGIVRYISGTEACLERVEADLWVVRVSDLTVIE